MRLTRQSTIARPPLPAFVLFFPAAAVVAAALALARALDAAGVIDAARLAHTPFWHGHEMVFGYAYAVIGGYLLTRSSTARAAIAFVAWAAGRTVHLAFALPPAVEVLIALAFPALLFAFAGLPFLKSIKSVRNMPFVPILLALGLAEFLYQVGVHGVFADGAARGLLLGIDIVALLLFTMGGRITAAATSGALQRAGVAHAGVAQGRLERVGVITLAAMAALDAFAAAPAVAGGLAALAGLTAGIRIVRWRFWRVRSATDVACLHLGHAWLALGLLLKGIAQASDWIPVFDALHVVTVGGLGTLSLTVMARVTQQRLRRPLAVPRLLQAAVALVSLAALARFLAWVPEWRAGLVLAAGVLWAGAFVCFLGFLRGMLGRRRG